MGVGNLPGTHTLFQAHSRWYGVPLGPMKNLVLGLLCERKIPVDRRAVLTPEQCASLLQNGIVERIWVEPSAVRIFDDSEYEAVGCTVTSD